MGSLAKWMAYASVVGGVVGLSTSGFLYLLTWATGRASAHPAYFVVLPGSLLAAAYLTRRLAPDAEGHGTEKVIEAVHLRSGRIDWRVAPVKAVTSVLTMATGGSVGKEGPCAQIGAGLASAISSLLRAKDVDRRKIVICGISAGFASVFGTPIAGALFGVEVLFLGQIVYDTLFPAFVSGLTGYYVTRLLGAAYFHHEIAALRPMTEGMLLKTVIFGLFCGLISVFLIEMVRMVHRGFRQLPGGWPVRACFGGVLLVLVGWLVSPAYLGLGLQTLQSMLEGQTVPATAFFWKSLSTAITLAGGGSGGVITPIFFVGASAGHLFDAMTASGDAAVYAAMGFCAVLAGCANTPIAASVLAVEMFGPRVAPFAALASVVSFVVSGHRSVYPSQVIAVQKSPSVPADVGHPVGRP